MASNPRQPSIATRSTPETKARFEALAASRGKTVAALLGDVIDAVLERNPVAAAAGASAATEEGEGASGRMSVRLRDGDRELLNVRAGARGMKAASYLAMLIHAHVRGRAPLPVAELNQLKASVGELSAIGRNLNQLARAANVGQVGDAAVSQALDAVRRQVAEVREHVAGLVRVNLESWEAGES
jgi:hypothetical protein